MSLFRYSLLFPFIVVFSGMQTRNGTGPESYLAHCFAYVWLSDYLFAFAMGFLFPQKSTLEHGSASFCWWYSMSHSWTVQPKKTKQIPKCLLTTLRATILDKFSLCSYTKPNGPHSKCLQHKERGHTQVTNTQKKRKFIFNRHLFASTEPFHTNPLWTWQERHTQKSGHTNFLLLAVATCVQMLELEHRMCARVCG